MSNINTNSIDANYPTPGINNSTQGFRDNFSIIKSNLDTASSELSDLQNKVILKSALNGSALDNDMANVVVSNMATKGFRSTSYNMGGSMPVDPETIIVDVSKADVHFGVVVGDTNFILAGWSPSLTLSSIELRLFIAEPTAKLNFPNTSYNSSGDITLGCTSSIRSCENYSSRLINGTPIQITVDTNVAPGGVGIVHTNTIGVPAGAKEIQLRLSSLDCGATIDVQPLNRPRKTSSIEIRTPSGLGKQGDTKGSICTDGTRIYVCSANYDGSTTIWKMTADGALVNAPT